MNYLKKLFRTKFNPAPIGALVAFAVIALLGFADATYLTVQHFMNSLPPCTFGNCELVLTSRYAVIFGVPTALWGALYYFSILVSALLYIDLKKDAFLRTALGLTCVGLGMSLWFLYLQMFVLHAYCQFCLISGGTSLTLFIFALTIFIKYRDESQA